VTVCLWLRTQQAELDFMSVPNGRLRLTLVLDLICMESDGLDDCNPTPFGFTHG
jgi:hypothetical protein